MNEMGILAKYWQPGSVKTRLAATIGPQAASHFHRVCLAVLLQRLHGRADQHVLVYWPLQRRSYFAQMAGGHWTLRPQKEGDLGARIEHYFTEALAGNAQRVVLVGSDSPTLPIDYIDLAWQALDRHRVVLGPTEDGGYYLVGLRGVVPPMFTGITWSSSKVWAQTVRHLRRAHVPYAELPKWYDVDNASDLERLHTELSQLVDDDGTWRELFAVVQEALEGPSF